ncbi:hypothetical protein PROFUN_00718 [Planoprotostelium fungivorum]|uniref:Endonuclease/exonuclease/phosphatase domain-containing protein n=1 Tax=Planoprotostelium fungivorum TaxID=1890364 RepID=A0A2P6NU52_9EUKA|nr:hypothetical protein PROFUN_00718 [Planoprotostelium fungivorum]
MAIDGEDSGIDFNIDYHSPPLTLATFNILAPCYFRKGGTLESADKEAYEKRHEQILNTIIDLNLSKEGGTEYVDIWALQEFWFKPSFVKMYEDHLTERGYSHSYLQRDSGRREDGLAVFFNNKKLELIETSSLLHDEVGHRVALLLDFRLKEKNGRFILITTHLTFPHSHYDEQILRMEQIETITSGLDSYISKNNLKGISVLLCGDLNSPVKKKDPVYIHLTDTCKFSSTYKSLHGNDAGCTHYNHLRQEASADFIFLRNPKEKKSRDRLIELNPITAFLHPR